ncbi:MAG: ACP S-malonyltransferase [Candidatus Eisenbacteria sp.]|nr:ACP S-malonyltransferase [Candidatus Eisenbacteria bacterium]
MKALLFPGQGSQFVGMGKDLFESFAAARGILRRTDEVLGFSLSGLMFDGPEEVLRETRNAQPAILAHSMAAWEACGAPWAPNTLVAAGHSLGEYTAYTVAGALHLEDALRIVRRRGELMYAAGLKHQGTMAAVLGADAERVQAACEQVEGIVGLANLNSPGQIVISGEVPAIGEVGRILKEQGAKRVIELKVSGAFHSPLMESAAEGLKGVLESAEIRPAQFPVYANASASPVVEPSEIRASLVRQLLQPVLWEPSMRAIARLAPEEFLEIGPGQVLKGLLRQTDRGFSCRTLGTVEELQAIEVGG